MSHKPTTRVKTAQPNKITPEQFFKEIRLPNPPIHEFARPLPLFAFGKIRIVDDRKMIQTRLSNSTNPIAVEE
jgi:hypothetical protein